MQLKEISYRKDLQLLLSLLSYKRRLKLVCFFIVKMYFPRRLVFFLTKNNNRTVVMCCAVCDLGWHLDCPLWAAMRRASSIVSSVYDNPEWVSDAPELFPTL